jgi:hypothetical protein
MMVHAALSEAKKKGNGHINAELLTLTGRAKS